MDMQATDIPVWEKFTLTIQEAAQYFNIGEKKIRKLAQENGDCGFALQNGSKVLIKREKFEEFINKATVI